MRERHSVTRVPSGFTFFPHYPINGTHFENVIKYEMCVRFSLQHLSEKFLIFRRNEQDMITNLCWSSRKVPLFLSDFKET